MTFENILFDARSVVTLVSFLTFIGILWWTYVVHRGDDFDAVARLPLDDDDMRDMRDMRDIQGMPTQSRENGNG